MAATNDCGVVIPLDHNGPRDVEYEPFGEAWVKQGIIPRFVAIAQRYSDHAAIIDGRGTLTYRSLSRAICRLVELIESEKSGPGPIGILLPHSAEFWVAILACLTARRPYVALDVHHPDSRNTDILNRSHLAAVMVPAAFDPAGEIIPAGLHRIVIDAGDSGQTEPRASFNPVDQATPAVILYTSGSTGHPKGVANSEAALLQRVAQYVNACHLHAGDRFLTLSSPCTIAGTREGLTALLIGGTLHVIDAQRRGLGDIAQCIHDARITVFNSVPSVLRALISVRPDAAETFRSLRIVRIGGEIVFWSDIRQFRRALPDHCHIQIGYSSTESTGTQWFVPPEARADGPFVPVGYVLPGNVASVRDETGHAVSPGDVGELVLRGRFIALGLWQDGRCIEGDIRPDDTDPASRVLHTGDLAHIDINGLCTIIGRKDRQVKINGMRVEPGEVEAALRDIEEIRDAAVIARRSGKTIALAAFVVSRHATAQSIPRIRAALRAVLPAPMRPAHIHLVEAIPQLPSGKPDLRALEAFARQADAEQTMSREADLAGVGVRQAVQRAWRSVLGRHALSEGVSFEDTGGDSLKLLQLVLALETQLGHRLPLDLFTGDMTMDDLTRILGSPRETTGVDVDGRPTVFLLPGLDGDEPRLAAFRAALNDRLRFVLIDYPDWPEMVRNGRSVDVVVDAAVAQVTATAPDGDLSLAGYSFGGDIAFAVASTLLKAGRTVSFLGIVDTDLHRVAGEAERFHRGYAMTDRQEIMQTVLHDRLDAAIGLLLAKCARDLVGLERVLRYGHTWRPLLSPRAAFAFDRRIRSILRVQARWQWHLGAAPAPAPIDIPTVLFRSSGHAAGTPADLGWQRRCSNLSILDVAGDHHTMWDPPHRAFLASAFADAVEATAAVHGVAQRVD
jgi:acyl-coenzyme A synthetase/AMP-(fatty) acid ligase/thioesterase domain-containing protein